MRADELLGGHARRVEPALHAVDAEAAQDVEVVLVLDALGDGSGVAGLAERDDGAEDADAVRIAGTAFDDVAIDLDVIGAAVDEEGVVGSADPEVVDGDPNAKAANPAHGLPKIV